MTSYNYSGRVHIKDIFGPCLVETRSSAVAVIADRTACSILTLFIVTATSRPLNKKSLCCQSANPINNYCGSASANLQSAHLSARALQSAQPHRPWWAVAPNGTVSSLIVDEPTRSVRNAITVYWESGGSSFFCNAFCG